MMTHVYNTIKGSKPATWSTSPLPIHKFQTLTHTLAHVFQNMYETQLPSKASQTTQSVLQTSSFVGFIPCLLPHWSEALVLANLAARWIPDQWKASQHMQVYELCFFTFLFFSFIFWQWYTCKEHTECVDMQWRSSAGVVWEVYCYFY